ncbi:hypothetical protein PGB90_004730 [Kerria lacca]
MLFLSCIISVVIQRLRQRDLRYIFTLFTTVLHKIEFPIWCVAFERQSQDSSPQGKVFPTMTLASTQCIEAGSPTSASFSARKTPPAVFQFLNFEVELLRALISWDLPTLLTAV